MLKIIGWIAIAALTVVLLAFLALNPPNTVSDLAAWVQGLGSVGAVFVAIFVINLQHTRQQNIEKARQDAEVSHMLTALRDEAETLLSLFIDRFGSRIAGIQTGEPLDSLYPVGTDVFQIFEGYKGSIGEIQDRDLRKKIVVAYAHARGLVYSIKLNNMLIHEYKQARTNELLNSTNETRSIMHGSFESLVNYASVIKPAWAQTQHHVQTMVDAINSQNGD